MNVEKILEVANVIENALPENFHMSTWFNEIETNYSTSLGDVGHYFDEALGTLNCGTTACIAGWTIAIKNDFKNYTYCDNHVEVEAAEYLGLTIQQAQRLFYCGHDTVWFEYQNEYDYSVTHSKDRCFEHVFQDEDCEDCYYSNLLKEPDDWDINNKDAASILKRIASGEIKL